MRTCDVWKPAYKIAQAAGENWVEKAWEASMPYLRKKHDLRMARPSCHTNINPYAITEEVESVD